MLALGMIAGIMESAVELGKARNWTAQLMQLEAMVNFYWEVTLACSTAPSTAAVPSTEVTRVAEDLKESLVHPWLCFTVPGVM